MPPGFWSKYLWCLIHGLFQMLDELAKKQVYFPVHEIFAFLRAIGALLPCDDCQQHFAQLLETEWNARKNEKVWKEGFFDFTVQVRQTIAKRLNRPLRNAEYCTQVFDLEWFANAWNALHIVSFAYPVHPTEEFMTSMRFFFQMLPKVFPKADPEVWNQVLNEDKEWYTNREHFMKMIHLLHTKAQQYPVLVVPPLDTLQIQWTQTLKDYLLEQKKQELEHKVWIEKRQKDLLNPTLAKEIEEQYRHLRLKQEQLAKLDLETEQKIQQLKKKWQDAQLQYQPLLQKEFEKSKQNREQEKQLLKVEKQWLEKKEKLDNLQKLESQLKTYETLIKDLRRDLDEARKKTQVAHPVTQNPPSVSSNSDSKSSSNSNSKPSPNPPPVAANSNSNLTREQRRKQQMERKKKI
jgi:hypothetical protein